MLDHHLPKNKVNCPSARGNSPGGMADLCLIYLILFATTSTIASNVLFEQAGADVTV